MLSNIVFLLPISGDKFYLGLDKLFNSHNSYTPINNGFTLKASNPINAFPLITFIKGSIDKIQVKFLDEYDHDLLEPQIQGLFTEYGNVNNSNTITLEELINKLTEHVINIDHVGINIPSKYFSFNHWNKIVNILSKQCNIYRYPDGKDWPFIIPATKYEHITDITEFLSDRVPKFELVYERFCENPIIQFDIQTDLNRSEAIKLFPDPTGISYPNLANIFRTVFIHHPLGPFFIRFDIRFKSNEKANDWNTGRWLVQNGGRIR